MHPCSYSKFHLPMKKWFLYRKLKKEEKKIFQAYPPYSPACPEFSPMGAVRELYVSTDPDVLFFHFSKLNKKRNLFSGYGEALVGLIGGILSGVAVTCIDKVSEVFSSADSQGISLSDIIVFHIWIFPITAFDVFAMIFSVVLSLFIVFTLLLYVRSIRLVFYNPIPLTDAKIETMRQVLRLDEYLFRCKR